MTLELVSGADFSLKFMCGAGPGDLGGPGGRLRPKIQEKNGPEISSQTAFRYPVLEFPEHGCTLGGNFEFSKGGKSAILGVWVAPGASEAISLGGRPRPPTF